jgi:uncharacterized protein
MNAAFKYGKIVGDNYFTNRDKEAKWLETQLQNGINCMLISPRRWGKSSLVQHVANRFKRQNKKTVFCFIDLYNVRSEQEFFELYSTLVIKAVSNNFEDAVRNVKLFFKQLMPSVNISPDPAASVELSFNWKDLKKNSSEILDLPEKAAKQKGIQVIMCIDEFQNISFLEDPLAFQKKLRAHWQQHKYVTYVLYGSRRHLMMDFFTKSSMPFYRFGEILFLEKIATPHWLKFISSRFEQTGKHIAEEYVNTIAQMMDNHPYFVQQLAQAVWLQTNKKVTAGDIDAALNNLLDQYEILYQKEADMLTNYQLNFLKALCNKETAFTSKAVLDGYNLGTSTNVSRIKTALQNKELIDVTGRQIDFNDPMFEIWLKKRYFKMVG